MSAEIKVQESTNAEEATSSQPIAKPHVGCSLSDVSIDEKRNLGSIIYLFASDLAACVYKYRSTTNCDVKITVELPTLDFEKLDVGYKYLMEERDSISNFLCTLVLFSFKPNDELKVP